MLVLAIVLGAGTARADKAAADAAFAEAKRLVAAGKLAAACPKFEVSYNEDPQVGVLLNLADCHEHVGKLATARAEFRSAIELAHQRNDNREKYARDRAAKLDNRVAHLVMHARPGVTGLKVTLDERDVTAMVDSDLPIDTGHHVIVATSAISGPSTTELDIERDGVRREVVVPEKLEPPRLRMPAASPPEVASAPPSEGQPPEATTLDAHARNVRHAIAAGVAGAGLVTLAVGFGFGVVARSHWRDAVHAGCTSSSGSDTDICPPEAKPDADAASKDATRSDVLVGVGAGVIAIAAVVWFTAPAAEHVIVTPIVGATTVGGSISIRF